MLVSAKPKLLITGSSGLLGHNLFTILDKDYDLSGIARDQKNHFVTEPLDLSNFRKLVDVLKKIKPKFLIHTAAISSHVECEKNPELARLLNYDVTKLLAEYSEELKYKFIFISSDAVFDGESGKYKEDDPTNPFSFYGELKVQAENYIRKNIDDYLILRGSFFGRSLEKNKSIFEFFYNNLQNGKKFDAYIDVISNSTDVFSLGKIIKSLIELNSTGIYHYGCRDSYSKYELAVSIAQETNLDINLIQRKNSDQVANKFFTKRDISLNTSKLERDLGSRMTSLQESIKLVLNQQ